MSKGHLELTHPFEILLGHLIDTRDTWGSAENSQKILGVQRCHFCLLPPSRKMSTCMILVCSMSHPPHYQLPIICSVFCWNSKGQNIYHNDNVSWGRKILGNTQTKGKVFLGIVKRVISKLRPKEEGGDIKITWTLRNNIGYRGDRGLKNCKFIFVMPFVDGPK